MHKHFNLKQIGIFVRVIASHLSDFCNHDTLTYDENKWHFKICMDECEILTSFQQLVINTYVRVSKWPVFPIVSYVSSPSDISSTLIPKLTLQQADRNLIVLDNMEQNEFKELTEGIASARCQEFMRSTDVSFNSETTLGKLNINALLSIIIDVSENQAKKNELLEDAREFANILDSSKCKEPPIYEAYLAKKLKLPIIKHSDSTNQRYQKSQQYRKKMVAAYLSICHELKVKKVRYASSTMVLSLSDNCVRDFLIQLDNIYQKSGWELTKFLNNQVSLELQSDAIIDASHNKRDSIPNSELKYPVQVRKIINGLAIITAIIQSSDDYDRHLRSTERGLFQLTSSETQSDKLMDTLEFIQDAIDAGFLRGKKGKDGSHTFRVHTSLAPAFGFSYRGAYYKVKLTLDDLYHLREANSENNLEKAARTIAKKISERSEDLTLFSNEDNDNGI